MTSGYPNPPINVCPQLIRPKIFPSEFDCPFCWQPKIVCPKQEIILENPKYCRLYPNYHKTLWEIKPKFEHCKTLYTKCDYYLEQKAHRYIIELEDLFKHHQELLKEELEKQKLLVDEMWIQSQRFIMLTQSVPCVKSYPEIISVTTEQRALYTFYCNLKKVHQSNCLLTNSMENIDNLRTELLHHCKQLDKTVESPFMMGAYYIRPLSYVLQILDDLFHYFYCNLCRQKRWAQLLDPGDSVSTADYMNILKSTKETDLMNNLDRCKCLRTKRKDCIGPRKTC